MGALFVVFTVITAVEPANAENPVAIVISSRRDEGGRLANEVASALKKQLDTQGIATLGPDEATARLNKLGAVDPKACDGARLCLSKLAQLLGPHGTVIGVDVGKAGRFNAGHLECVSATRLESLAVADFTADAKKWLATRDEALKAFVAEVAPKLRGLLAQPVATTPNVSALTPGDAPVNAQLTPGAPPPPPLVVAQPTPAVPTAAWVTGGGAVASAGVAVTFLVLGLNHKAAFDGSQVEVNGRPGGSTLTQTQLNSLARSSNNELTVATATGAAAGALTAATLYLLLRNH
ncbi:MAG: hypothetical protein K1X64_12845 [Myxococcaceae bacterium]|nr:hypothetical protein [Myxococcaceae bacterium]